jgi:phosphoglycerol transferase MdoB-like AlkP superfamily enzyme
MELSLREPHGITVTAARSRFSLVWLLAACYLAISSLTRATLYLRAWMLEQVTASDAISVFTVGAVYDAIAALFLVAPFTLYLLLVPNKAFARRWHRFLVWTGLGLTIFGLAYISAVEYFFFDEFNARFNYVAVEYLIYPHEVFVNIWQSYPVARALIASAVAAGLLLWSMRRRIAAALESRDTLRSRGWPVLVLLILLVAAHFGIDSTSGRSGHNRVADELAANGVYSFFSAAITSDLDYRAYYLTVDDQQAVARARRFVSQPNARFIEGAANPLARRIHYTGAPRLLHVVVLLEESLGAEFVGAYGDRRGLTPNIDRIARESLLFTNAYATGTRTVRGMEAVTASFPPVPAESIVKRRRNEGMFNWSEVMRKNGYSPTFIYGGYGTFDNMNYFFGNNGYRVVDRTDMNQPEFSNIWGVSDKDLFRNALRVFDEQVARGERVFSVVMTTSNHKPFTFPPGVPGVPERGGGRDAGAHYADYAIGRFIDALAERPYGKDTLVVIVADHGARVYGREDIPLPSYEIPFMVYAPHHVRPGRVNALTSQIDVAPTVLGLLNISYDSTFFGRDVLAARADEHRALFNHNRDIALYTDGTLNELGFRHAYSTLSYDPGTHRQTPAPSDPEGLKNAAAVFQLAYDLYRGGRYRVE